MRAGFTLIELLIVLAIVAVLAGLLLPALNSLRNAARQVQCTANLGQMGMVVKSNAQDNRGLIMLGSNLDGTTWRDTLLAAADTTSASRLLACPAASIRRGSMHYGAQFNLFAMAGRIPVAPATTVGGWRAKQGRLSELRAGGVLLFDTKQTGANGDSGAIPTEQEAMWDWYTGNADDRKGLNGAPDADDTGNSYKRARYRHPGQRCGILWGDGRASVTAWSQLTRGDFRCAKNGRKQQWEPN
ncbi:MAG: type II secretion system protein [Planctomycetes bacterium]|nr:type II secretion system protein [Planctomycetota bacterium]